MAVAVDTSKSAPRLRQESWFDPWQAEVRVNRSGTCYQNPIQEVKWAEAIGMAEALVRALEDMEEEDVAQRVRLFVLFCKESRGFTISLEGL